MNTNDQVTESLRQWARGIYPIEAAVELVSRFAAGRFASADWPWIERRGAHRYVLDADQITEDSTAALSGGEARVLRIVASLAGATDSRMSLYDDVAGLDRATLDLVLAAIAHAGGSHDDRAMERRPARSSTGEDVEIEMPTGELAGSLYPWPQTGGAQA